MEIIRADLHIHTTYSDGKNSPKEVIYHAMNIGLNAIAITDHDTFQGAVVGNRIAKSSKLELVVIIGIEVRTDKGDVLVYCDHPIDVPRNVDMLIDKARVENCIVVPAHPYDLRRFGVGDEIFNYRWDAIEVFNASSSSRANKKALRAAKILGLPGLANSDAHILDFIGVAYNEIQASSNSIDDILEAVRKGKVKPIAGRPSISSYAKYAYWSIARKVRGIWEE